MLRWLFGNKENPEKPIESGSFWFENHFYDLFNCKFTVRLDAVVYSTQGDDLKHVNYDITIIYDDVVMDKNSYEFATDHDIYRFFFCNSVRSYAIKRVNRQRETCEKYKGAFL